MPRSVRAPAEAWVSYAALILLHTKVTWGMWWVRDLTSGDTSSYFFRAHGWHTHWSNTIAWSPAYTVFYGSFLSVSEDAYVATVLHRLVASLVASLLVLSVARTLMGEPVAWLVAAWWTVLPINYDTLYEVHLFSAIPILVAYRIAFGGPERWRPGAALGVMAAAATLVRNELLVATGLMAAGFAVWECRARRAGEAGWLRGVAWRYGVPLGVCVALVAAAYGLSEVKYPALREALRRKHTVNVCQVYAFGYQQRNPDWRRSPWTECRPLMRATFGQDEPSMAAAARANPRAMLEHLAWNASLIPNGLQVLLFNGTSGRRNPDYPPVRTGVWWTILASFAVLGALAWGLARLARDPALRGAVVAGRRYGWVTVLAVLAVGVVVMLTQRPRPSYLFGVSVALMVGTGSSLWWGAGRWLAGRNAALWLAGISCVVIALAPGQYTGGRTPPRRPLLEAYRRLSRFAAEIQVPGRVLVTPGFGNDLCAYLRAPAPFRCRGVHYVRLREAVEAGRPWGEVLAESGANMLYASEAVTREPALAGFLAEPERWGWRRLWAERTKRGTWVLVERPGPGAG